MERKRTYWTVELKDSRLERYADSSENSFMSYDRAKVKKNSLQHINLFCKTLLFLLLSNIVSMHLYSVWTL